MKTFLSLIITTTFFLLTSFNNHLISSENSVSQSSVEFQIPLSYGTWKIDNKPEEYKGKKTLTLNDGTHSIKGDFNWQLDFKLENENIIPDKITPGNFGRDLSGLFCYGKSIQFPDPKGKRLIISIPDEKGEYEVKGLLPKGKRDRALFLPEGENIIEGQDWKIKVTIKDNAVTAEFLSDEKDSEQTNGDNNILTVRNNVILWNDAKIIIGNSTTNSENTLNMSVNRNKKYFRRDEYMLLNIIVENNQPLKDNLTVSALQGEQEHQFLIQGWSINPGKYTRSFEIPLYLLEPGKYSIKARFASFESQYDIEVFPSPYEKQCVFDIINSDATKAPGSVAKNFFTANIINSNDLIGNINNCIKEGLESIVYTNTNAADKKVFMRNISAQVTKAREFKPFSSYMLNINNTSELNDSKLASIKKLVSSLSKNINLGISLPAEQLSAEKEKCKYADEIYAASGNSLTTLFNQEKRCCYNKTIFEINNKAEAWLALMLGGKSISTKIIPDADFTEKWKMFSGTIKAIVAAYFKSIEEPVYSVSDDKNTIITSYDSQGISYRLAFCKKNTTVKLPLALDKKNVYDVFNSTYITVPEMSMTADIQMQDNDFRLFLLTSAKPSLIETSAKPTATVELPYAVRCYAKIIDENNRLLTGILPAEINIQRESGENIATLYRYFKNGVLDVYYPLGLNTSAGKIIVKIKSCGISAENFFINEPKLRNFLRRIRERTILEIEDQSAIRKFINNNSNFTVAIENVAYLENAMIIKRYLEAARKKVSVKMLNEILGEKMPAPEIIQGMPDDSIAKNLILMGRSCDNSLIDLLANKLNLTPYRLDENFPGNSKGIIQYCRKAFSPVHDVVVVSGSSITGVKLAANRLATGRGN